MAETESSESKRGRHDVRTVARQIAARIIAPGFAVDSATTVLFLNSLVSALHSHHRIYINAFQRSGEVLNHFGHRLRRLGFDVHSLDPRSIIPSPQPRDVLVCVSGSLRTEPVLVSLMHAELGGLYKFVITAQTAEDARKKFQTVLPVHIPGVTREGRAAEETLRSILPLGSLFEVRAFVYLEAVIEVLSRVLLENDASAGASEVDCAGPSPDLMFALTRVREESGRVPETMQALIQSFVATIDDLEDQPLDAFLKLLLETGRSGATTYVTGYGRNNEIGCMFVHRLANLGLPVALTPSRLERRTRRGDLLVAVSGSGHTYEVLQRIQGARRSGLRTTTVSAVSGSPAATASDIAVIVPAEEPTTLESYNLRQFQPAPPIPPSRSTFSLHSFLVLESVVAVLMQAMGKREKDLLHTDPWQGYDSPEPDYPADSTES